jgi:EpsI family protein
LGQAGNKKIIIVVVLFLLTTLFIYGKPEPKRSIKNRSLNEALADVEGWKAGPSLSFDKAIVETLALDDYLNRVYTKGDKAVSLYIGYYLTSGKVGAAHDPLVCFPGQGWNVSDRDSGRIKIDEGADLTVDYSVMRVKRGSEDNQIILYWFQSYQAANASTLLQKITTVMQKFTDAREDNAFVRLSCAADDKSEAECIETMQDFTRAFYPVFLEYIRE